MSWVVSLLLEWESRTRWANRVQQGMEGHDKVDNVSAVRKAFERWVKTGREVNDELGHASAVRKVMMR